MKQELDREFLISTLCSCSPPLLSKVMNERKVILCVEQDSSLGIATR
jgi:hypothetical protein